MIVAKMFNCLFWLPSKAEFLLDLTHQTSLCRCSFAIEPNVAHGECLQAASVTDGHLAPRWSTLELSGFMCSEALCQAGRDS